MRSGGSPARSARAWTLRRVKLAAIKVATKLGVKEGASAAFALLADEKQRSDVRVEALKALSSLKAAKLSDAVKLALASTEA